MDWNVDAIPDQSGRVALVTGANSGLGFETAKALLEKGAILILCCRSLAKAKVAREELYGITNSGKIELLIFDLGNLIEVNKAVDQLERNFQRLDLLINNAGVMAPPRTLSKQGLEIQFAVNHLAHMALTLRSLPLMAQQNDARVVTVTSGAQYMGKIIWDDLQGQNKYDRWVSYAQSKLANVMFALELHNRLCKSKYKVASLLAHPGLAQTNLQRTSVAANGSWQESLAYKLIGPMFQSAKMGALPQLLAATNPTARSGEQYGPKFNFRGYPKLIPIAPLALNKSYRERLWEVSKLLIGDLVDIKGFSS